MRARVNSHRVMLVQEEELGTARPVKVLAMLVLPLLVAAVVACDNSGGAARGPYEGTIEGKPPNLGPSVPDPKEVVETKPAGQLPEFLDTNPLMEGPAKESALRTYQGAVDYYDSYKYIPCYCGCAIYTTAHRNLAECYIKERKPDGSLAFTDHSLTCDLCQQAALMTLDGLAQNKPLKDIRAEVFQKLKYTGIWTDTPPVP